MGCGASSRVIPDGSLAQFSGHTAGILALCTFLTRDGETRFASASHDRSVRVWNPNAPQHLVHVLEGHTDFLTSIVAFSVDGNPRLASGSADMSVRIWDPVEGRALNVMTGHLYFIKVMATFVDEKGTPIVASAALDGTLRTWNGSTGASVAVISVHPKPPGHELSSIQRRTIMPPPRSSGRSSAKARSSRHAAKPAAPARNQKGAPIFSIDSFSKGDGPRLVTGHADAVIRIWVPRSGAEPETRLEGHVDAVFAVHCFPSDGDGSARLASGSGDFSVRIWDLANGTCLHVFAGAHDEKVTALITFKPEEGPLKIASASGDAELAIWDAEATPALETAATHTEAAAAGPHDPDVEVLPRSEAINRLAGHTTVVSSVSVYATADGRPRLASGAWDGVVRLWDPFATDAVL